MGAAKEHKFLTADELGSIIESSEAELMSVQPELDALAAKVFAGAGTLKPAIYAELVKKGIYSAATVRDKDGEPQFVLIYSRSSLNWLYVEAVASLKRSTLKEIFGAVDKIAEHYKCVSIQCATILRGMFKFSLKIGYRPAGVLIVKNALPA